MNSASTTSPCSFDGDDDSTTYIKSTNIQRCKISGIERTYQFLSNPPIFLLNGGDQVSCFYTNVGTVSIFNIPIIDIHELNKRFQQILKRLNVNMKKNNPIQLEINETLFFQRVETTMILDENGALIKYPPRVAFHAVVSLKIIGIKFTRRDKEDNFSVTPIVCLNQVFVTSRDC